MSLPKFYRTFADFEREEIRPNFKVGFSMEDLVDEASFENSQNADLDRDPLDWDESLPTRSPRRESKAYASLAMAPTGAGSRNTDALMPTGRASDLERFLRSPSLPEGGAPRFEPEGRVRGAGGQARRTQEPP